MGRRWGTFGLLFIGSLGLLSLHSISSLVCSGAKPQQLASTVLGTSYFFSRDDDIEMERSLVRLSNSIFAKEKHLRATTSPTSKVQVEGCWKGSIHTYHLRVKREKKKKKARSKVFPATEQARSSEAADVTWPSITFDRGNNVRHLRQFLFCTTILQGACILERALLTIYLYHLRMP